MDVAGIPVRRGDEATRTARRLAARAFTSDGVVHIPDHLGALDSHTAAPLLAHELTHAVQQRRFGAALPAPGTTFDRRLEDDAVAVEQWVGGGAVGAPPPTVVRQLAAEDDDLPVVDTGALMRDFEEATGSPVTVDVADLELPDVSVGGLFAAYQDLQELADQQTEDDSTPASETSVVDLIADNPPRRWLDLDDPDNFEEIANRLYHHLVGRLRFDVLVERERSGTLLDFS